MKPGHEGWFLYDAGGICKKSNPVHVTKYPGSKMLIFYDPPFLGILTVNKTDDEHWFGEVEWKKK
jgi:hypothetical protein